MENGRNYIQIDGRIAAVIYSNEENGYTVLRLNTGENEPVTVVGCIPAASAGEELTALGTWATHSAYGQQFKAEQVSRRLPDTKRAVFEFLAFGAIKGIGPALAEAIVNKFGRESLDVIEEDPLKLAEIRGISEQKARNIGKEFARQMGLRRLMEFLTHHGLKPYLAVRLYKVYGDTALGVVRENPYILAEDFFGADFFEADTLALNLGFEGDSRERVEAAVLFELKHNLNNGHTFLPRAKLIGATAQLIEVGTDTIEDALEALLESGFIVEDEIAGQNACYLEAIYEAERYTAERLFELSSYTPRQIKNAGKTIDEIEAESGIKYAKLQRQAVELAAEHGVMVLTGGPGTGKTTAVRTILALFDKMGLNTALAAPTGRAAKRMSELSGREALTVHRLLGAGFAGENEEIIFERDENDPLQNDAVILDEASMIDITLMAALLKAIKSGSRLVLVGDADQLPSVGPGNVFSDIIRSGLVPTVRLNEIFRQAGESRIIKNAHMINRGEMPELGENSGDFFFLQRGTKEKTADTVAELVAERLPKNMGIEPKDIQVLTPSRKGETGTWNLNRLIQAAVNPPEDGKKEKNYGEFVFREGDRVMQIRNNYDIIWKKQDGVSAGAGIFNGDIGKILSIDYARETVIVEYEDKQALYSFDMLGELEPAYAMTVHKSQGSEYKAVVLSAQRCAPSLLTRGVLYTAVTRARKLLIIVGDREVVGYMTGNNLKQKRYSGLKARLSR